MNSRSDWWSLDWYVSERYWCWYQWMETVSPTWAHVRGQTFQTFL